MFTRLDLRLCKEVYMRIIRHKPLSEAKNEVTKQALEQEISDLEIELIEQDRALTDHDIAIIELQEKVGK